MLTELDVYKTSFGLDWVHFILGWEGTRGERIRRGGRKRDRTPRVGSHPHIRNF